MHRIKRTSLTICLRSQGRPGTLLVVQGDKAVKREVEVGQRNGLMAQIVSGIKAGDNVIVHPGDQVKDGVRVAVR